MANFFNLTLDTTGPSNPTITIEGGATFATQQLVTCAVSTGDGVTTGYQMKFWGDIDLTWGKANGIFNGAASATAESDALYITYATSKQLQLSTGDGLKTIYTKIRDDVYNISAQASDSINLDMTLPTVTITGPDVSKISKQAGKNVSSFSFQVDCPFLEYKVKIVSASGASQDTGTVIGTAGGSTNMSGTGSFPATTPINCSINGTDLETASPGDAAKIVKVFVRDESSQWSA